MVTGLNNAAVLAQVLLGGWEVILIFVVLTCVSAAWWVTKLKSPGENTDKLVDWLGEQLILWVAQGFGTGRLPGAPGLFGSLVGMLWFLMLVQMDNLWVYFGGTLFGLGLSVWLCGFAEKILKQTDPPTVVLDEITAVPLCFSAWIIIAWVRTHTLPTPESFFTAQAWMTTLIVFGLFRLFDVLKPWPIRQSQKLPGGWGVTIDDVLAAILVALLTLVALR